MTAPRPGLPRYALLRHAPARVAPGLCYGRLDLEPGPADLPALRAALAGFADAPLFSSPARRCHVLAEALAQGRPIGFDDRLLELDFGAWEGRPWDDIPRAALDAWAADPLGFAPPGGESGAALIARVRDFAAALPPRALVIGHGGPLKLLADLLAGRPPDLLGPAPALGSITLR
ncbi:histidine phosphatase family protein [Pseudoroseomonas cervicalis]|uniref:histidine phosphatase family protein n=1 Tax=Teichococcus cervicalis TaxID=204525 RepID=UPI0027853A6B|nr:histidine phosphatase family protein [Pseudoroseomonas cervicalis]MDQ1080729.1 alpha-ribazole phosphatase [Pseudoroseomonas cervicalis]